MASIPEGVIIARKRICAGCGKGCSVIHEDPCATCPITPAKWRAYGQCKNFGLGDAVALVAQPIAKAIDAVAGTNLKECGGCAKRRAALNALPFQTYVIAV